MPKTISVVAVADRIDLSPMYGVLNTLVYLVASYLLIYGMVRMLGKAAESVMLGANLYAPGVLKAPNVKRGDEVNIVSPLGDVVGFGIALMN